MIIVQASRLIVLLYTMKYNKWLVEQQRQKQYIQQYYSRGEERACRVIEGIDASNAFLVS